MYNRCNYGQSVILWKHISLFSLLWLSNKMLKPPAPPTTQCRVKLVERLWNHGPIFWQNDTSEGLLLLNEAQRSPQHQWRTGLCSFISQVSEPHVGSRGAQSNRIGRSTHHATCIKPQDYDWKTQRGCKPVQWAPRAGRRPSPSRAQLGSA